MRANFRTFVRREERKKTRAGRHCERLLFLVTTEAIIDDRGPRRKPPARSPSPSKSLTQVRRCTETLTNTRTYSVYPLVGPRTSSNTGPAIDGACQALLPRRRGREHHTGPRTGRITTT
ncbi:hypothetical protein MTO96_003913 [Rhipicephalus appendiculatus]